jgi:hypothetical protein
VESGWRYWQETWNSNESKRRGAGIGLFEEPSLSKGKYNEQLTYLHSVLMSSKQACRHKKKN